MDEAKRGSDILSRIAKIFGRGRAGKTGRSKTPAESRNSRTHSTANDWTGHELGDSHATVAAGVGAEIVLQDEVAHNCGQGADEDEPRKTRRPPKRRHRRALGRSLFKTFDSARSRLRTSKTSFFN